MFSLSAVGAGVRTLVNAVEENIANLRKGIPTPIFAANAPPVDPPPISISKS